ncbi:glycoside hydrolase family 18 protein [Serpula lacrymans var. lacrymans S7.3]|uniref:Glycoside hydrolase family 18 protein n=1 Tax=Serpula lacrymans var. lacrymans (strain S7.3) TaxID=936435 RepID=F8QAY5_SERL3|nr:glycoside hydrolase family 18 protein [Serpula lacrymans var. lacrymans S7.3]
MVSTSFTPHSPFRSILLLLVAIFTISSAVDATQVMRRPEGYKNTPSQVETVQVSPQIVHKRANSHVQAAYFTNWGIYGANFQPTNITPSDLTHILYAFADVSSSTGTISLTDSYADEQKHYPGDSWSEAGNNLYGCLKQLYLLKLANRNLKVLLSIGGWTYSQAGHFSFVTDATSRATFVSSAVQLIKDYGFDGIDLDFEYPSNSAEGQGFADLLTALRTAFSQLETSNGDTVPYELTAAVSAGAPNYAYYVVPQMDQALSYWNLMSYDYAGSWLTWADNQANLYGGSRTNVSTDAAIKHYLASGATASKINMGIPLYGRAFEDTNGIGDPYSGIGPGTIQAGIYSYKDLPLAGAQVFENTTDVTSYSYDSTKKELVSYDVPDIVKIKADYVVSNNLAGTMFWDLSTDSTGSTSLVATAAGVYSSLDQTQNHINYPSSKWDNIRNNMDGSSSSTSTTATQTSTASSTPTSPSGSGSCAGVGAWGSGTVYTVGQTATYNGHLWTAKWWTQGDTPGGSAGAWTDGGVCTSSKRSMRFRF